MGDILRFAARRDPRKTAIVAGERQMTFAEYDAASNRFANLLAAAGLRKGDRIASVLFNGAEYGIVHFGNARAGSILVHVSPMYAAPEIGRIVERTRPRVLVADIAVADKIGKIRSQMGSVERILYVGGDFDDALRTQPDTDPAIAIDPAGPVAMTFTGGTTGEPKGAVVSHTAR